VSLVSKYYHEVTDVCKHVKDCHNSKGRRGSNLESLDRVFGLSKGIVGVGVTDIRPNNIVEGSHDAVAVLISALSHHEELQYLRAT